MTEPVFLYAGWEPIVRILVVGALMYVALVVLLRTSGSRSIASMKAFDFIVTVALGSVFGRVLTAKGVSLAEALAAFGLLIGLQYVVARLQSSSRAVSRVVTNPPVLLYFGGQFLPDALAKARITESELRGVVRKKGQGSLDEVEALVLEASGDVAVVKKLGDRSAFGPELSEQVQRAEDD